MAQPRFDLKAYRKAQGWTQGELASKLGFSRSYIAMIESGRQGLSSNMMYEIIRKLDADYEDFFLHEKESV